MASQYRSIEEESSYQKNANKAIETFPIKIQFPDPTTLHLIFFFIIFIINSSGDMSSKNIIETLINNATHLF